MRYLAQTVTNSEIIKQILLYDDGEEVYMFPFTSLEDGTANGDYWFETLQDAMEACKEEYGIDGGDWSELPDPDEFCQQDWIAPVRIIGRNIGEPQWGRLEKLVDGEWAEI